MQNAKCKVQHMAIIKPDAIIDATDKTVMAGGIDVHSHDRTSPACLSFYPIKSLTYMVI